MTNIRVIYTITVFNIRGGIVKTQRTWGWYNSFEEAQEQVLGNGGDIYEHGFYNVAVIESVPEGVIPISDEHWYSVDFDGKYKIEKAEKPGIFEHVIGFSMG